MPLLEERIDSSILKLVYNGINKENMSANLKLDLKNQSEHREITCQYHRERQKHEQHRATVLKTS